MPTQNPTTGERLLAARKAKKLSQRALADLVGSTQNYIWELEHDRQSPRVDFLSRIANALDINTRDLVPRGPK